MTIISRVESLFPSGNLAIITIPSLYLLQSAVTRAWESILGPEQVHGKDPPLPTEASQLLLHVSWLNYFGALGFIFLYWSLLLWMFMEKYGHFYLPNEFLIACGDRW